jgi:hypothetical protein
MSNHFGSLHITKKALNLPIEAFLGFHPEHGWNLTKMLCTAIIKFPFGILFNFFFNILILVLMILNLYFNLLFAVAGRRPPSLA